MSIYAIGDLHLSLNKEKPMDIFGGNWKNHEQKIKENWKNTVQDNDLVILPGDFSWEMHLKDMYNDFAYLNDLPGKKLLIKGNHDYWWTTLAKMREFLQENKFVNIDFLYNNSYLFEDKIIAGTRGWALNDTENSNKMNHREEERLKLSLQSGVDNFGDREIICIMHYPPIIKVESDAIQNSANEEKSYSEEDDEIEKNSEVVKHAELNKNLKISNYVQIMKDYNVKTCLYGHLHGESHKEAFEGIIDGINFKLVSSDYLDFKLYKLE